MNLKSRRIVLIISTALFALALILNIVSNFILKSDDVAGIPDVDIKNNKINYDAIGLSNNISKYLSLIFILILLALNIALLLKAFHKNTEQHTKKGYAITLLIFLIITLIFVVISSRKVFDNLNIDKKKYVFIHKVDGSWDPLHEDLQKIKMAVSNVFEIAKTKAIFGVILMLIYALTTIGTIYTIIQIVKEGKGNVNPNWQGEQNI